MGRRVTQPTGDDLKTLLWETINNVKSGKITARDSNAISSGARAICEIVKMEMTASKMGKSKRVPAKTSKFINGR